MGDERIRLATAADQSVLAEIYRRASLSNEGDRELLLANPQHLVFDSTGPREGRTVVAVDDHDRPLGFATTVELGEGALELEDLFVDPDHMRRGIARRLMLAVAERARANDAHRIEVTANPHADAFYRVVGFVPGEAVRTELGAGVRMVLTVV